MESSKEKRTVAILAQQIKARMEGEGTGHDWWHVYRVWRNALYIARREKSAGIFEVQLAALLHDVADWKFSNGDTEKGGRVAKSLLRKLKVNEKTIGKVCYIVDNISFKGGFGKVLDTKEGMIVQDADRIDALGAIGIARAFAYGGSKGRELYNPKIRPMAYKNFEHFRKAHAKSTTVNHFYEKLFLLRGQMNTKTGKEIAKEREEFMKKYLDTFYKEWKGL